MKKIHLQIVEIQVQNIKQSYIYLFVYFYTLKTQKIDSKTTLWDKLSH
jgi:hypothetical protein